MVSLRFPFLFSQSAKQPFHSPVSTSRGFNATVVALSLTAAAAGVAAAVSRGVAADPKRPFVEDALSFFLAKRSSVPLWGSLSLSDASSLVVDSRSGVSFPQLLSGSRQLLGVGLRKKSILGLKNIDVYAFGVYADNSDIKKSLGNKYAKLSSSDIVGSKELTNDLLESDVNLTVRLQIMYSKLSIRSVRSAFEDSVGSRLKKFGGSDNGELLQRFTSQFKDEYKIPRGSVIELARESGHVLRTTIDGKEIGSIQSKLLCRSLLDLYIGDDPFDRLAKEDVNHNLASVFNK